jgi:hypothetical protein
VIPATKKNGADAADRRIGAGLPIRQQSRRGCGRSSAPRRRSASACDAIAAGDGRDDAREHGRIMRVAARRHQISQAPHCERPVRTRKASAQAADHARPLVTRGNELPPRGAQTGGFARGELLPRTRHDERPGETAGPDGCGYTERSSPAKQRPRPSCIRAESVLTQMPEKKSVAGNGAFRMWNCADASMTGWICAALSVSA